MIFIVYRRRKIASGKAKQQHNMGGWADLHTTRLQTIGMPDYSSRSNSVDSNASDKSRTFSVASANSDSKNDKSRALSITSNISEKDRAVSSADGKDRAMSQTLPPDGDLELRVGAIEDVMFLCFSLCLLVFFFVDAFISGRNFKG